MSIQNHREGCKETVPEDKEGRWAGIFVKEITQVYLVPSVCNLRTMDHSEQLQAESWFPCLVPARQSLHWEGVLHRGRQLVAWAAGSLLPQPHIFRRYCLIHQLRWREGLPPFTVGFELTKGLLYSSLSSNFGIVKNRTNCNDWISAFMIN